MEQAVPSLPGADDDAICRERPHLLEKIKQAGPQLACGEDPSKEIVEQRLNRWLQQSRRYRSLRHLEKTHQSPILLQPSWPALGNPEFAQVHFGLAHSPRNSVSLPFDLLRVAIEECQLNEANSNLRCKRLLTHEFP